MFCFVCLFGWFVVWFEGEQRKGEENHRIELTRENDRRRGHTRGHHQLRKRLEMRLKLRDREWDDEPASVGLEAVVKVSQNCKEMGEVV